MIRVPIAVVITIGSLVCCLFNLVFSGVILLRTVVMSVCSWLAALPGSKDSDDIDTGCLVKFVNA